jgi:WD40 repeat protein
MVKFIILLWLTTFTLRGNSVSRLAPPENGLPLPALAVITAANAPALTPLARLGRGVIAAMAWSPDGETLAIATTLGVWLYGADDDYMTESRLLGGQDGARSLAFRPDGALLASGGVDAGVAIWDMASGDLLGTLTNHIYGVNGLAFSPGGDRLASSDLSGVIRVWDLRTQTDAVVLQSEGGQPMLAFSPDGSLLAAGGGQMARAWTVATGERLLEIEEPGDGVQAAFSDDGQTLAISATRDRGGIIWQWDVGTGALQTFQTNLGALGLYLDGNELVYMVRQGRVIRLENRVSGSSQPLVIDYDGESIAAAAFNPSHGRLATMTLAGDLRVWDTSSGTERARLPGYSNPLVSLAFSEAGDGLVVDDGAGGLSGWALMDGTQTPGIESPPLLEWSANRVIHPDGAIEVVGGNDSVVHLHDVESGNETGALHGHIRGVTSVAVSPDGSLLVSASLDRSLRVFDLTTGATGDEAALAVLAGHTGGVTGVVFNAAGTLIASSSFDGTVVLWGVSKEKT